jgi:excisionase family DNA binding protein
MRKPRSRRGKHATERTYSTAEVSRMWQVGESTIKRWSDAGDLACIRTPGGHRRFTLEALMKFQREQHFTVAGSLPGDEWSAAAAEDGRNEAHSGFSERLERALTTRNLTELQNLYYEAATSGDERSGVELLQRAYLRGFSDVELKEQVLTPALHLVGDRWRRGELNIYEEHLASQVTLSATGHLHAHTPHRERIGRTALCGCPEGDFHEIALHLVAELLETEGWDVIFMGANTPIFSFTDAVRRFSPHILCISSTIIVDLERLRRDYVQFWPVTRESNTRVVIGGAAFADSGVRDIFLHDFYATDFSAFLAYLRTEFPAHAPVATTVVRKNDAPPLVSRTDERRGEVV